MSFIQNRLQKSSFHGYPSKTKTKTTEAKPGTKAEDPDKYKNYFHFEYGINGVRPHQVQFVIAI